LDISTERRQGIATKREKRGEREKEEEEKKEEEKKEEEKKEKGETSLLSLIAVNGDTIVTHNHYGGLRKDITAYEPP
jgi:hypothetical protein